jgi:hypothetical protein
VTTIRLLAAAVLACGAGPVHALGPWELAAGLQFDPVYLERVGRDRPAHGVKAWASLGPLMASMSSEDDGRTTKPVNLNETFSFGVGLRLRPVGWFSAQAEALVATTVGESTDVNLRDWIGPQVEYVSKGLRLQAAVGPRLNDLFPYLMIPKHVWWRPVVTVSWTRLWARTYGDRFRTWGGDARYLSFGLGFEAGLKVR